MKKILFIVSLFVSCVSYGQIVGPTGNTPYNRGIGVWDGTGDSLMAQQSDKRWTMAQKHDVYGVNARGNHWYGSLAGSSATVSTEGLIAIGHNAARLINTGGYGIYMGWQAGYNLPSASYGNIFIGGYRPGFDQTAGSRNLLLGYLLNLQSLTGDNQMNIMAAIFGKDVGEVTGQNISGGNIGIMVGNPTARLHLPAGQATAEKAPLKFTSGTNLTAAEAGAVEYNGTSFFFSPSTTRLRAVLTNNSIPSNGQIPIGNGTNYTNAALASADGSVTITNGAGTIDLAAMNQTASTYVATITGTANLSASSNPNFQYTKINDYYTVWGEVTLDPTTTATLTLVRISLPLTSLIANTYDLIGTASDDLGTSVRICGDVGNGEAELRFTPVDVTNRVFSVWFKFKWSAP